MNSIAITGTGIICAIGNDKEQVLDALLHRRTGIAAMQYLCSTHHELPVGEVKLSNNELKTALGIDRQREVSRTELLGVTALMQAVREAGICRTDGKRVVLVNGTTVGGMDITEQHYAALRSHADEHLPQETLECLRHHDCGSSTAGIAHFAGCFDDFTTVSTACSSAANAIILAAQLLDMGLADIVVAGGTESLSVFHLNGFNSLMILDHERCRPFDRHRAGLNLGEGAAYLVMERADDARKQGRHVYGFLNGWGNACDAYHQTASSPDGEGAFRAMRQALEMGNIKPQDIQYVNAHGTGTPDNDRSESIALHRIFGDDLPPVSSTKSFTGHTTSASGSIEAIICLLAMHHHFLPANLGWQEAMEDGIVPTLGEDHATVVNVLTNAFGFGGNDSSLLFSLNEKKEETGDEDHDSSTPSSDRYAHICEELMAVIDQQHTPSDDNCLAAVPMTAVDDIHLLSCVEIHDEADLPRLKAYVKPMEMRRMGKILKSALLSSYEALHEAGTDCPDAIVTATAWGCMESSLHLLDELVDNGEELIKPTYFMQSTHNTISSAIAIKLKDHGYNVTITQQGDSLRWAILQAVMLIKSGRCRSVLVGCHDETPLLLQKLLRQMGKSPALLPVHSLALVLSCGESSL